jgi:hypothetical protein
MRLRGERDSDLLNIQQDKFGTSFNVLFSDEKLYTTKDASPQREKKERMIHIKRVKKIPCYQAN